MKPSSRVLIPGFHYGMDDDDTQPQITPPPVTPPQKALPGKDGSKLADDKPADDKPADDAREIQALSITQPVFPDEGLQNPDKVLTRRDQLGAKEKQKQKAAPAPPKDDQEEAEEEELDEDDEAAGDEGKTPKAKAKAKAKAKGKAKAKSKAKAKAKAKSKAKAKAKAEPNTEPAPKSSTGAGKGKCAKKEGDDPAEEPAESHEADATTGKRKQPPGPPKGAAKFKARVASAQVEADADDIDEMTVAEMMDFAKGFQGMLFSEAKEKLLKERQMFEGNFIFNMYWGRPAVGLKSLRYDREATKIYLDGLDMDDGAGLKEVVVIRNHALKAWERITEERDV